MAEMRAALVSNKPLIKYALVSGTLLAFKLEKTSSAEVNSSSLLRMILTSLFDETSKNP
jgi:hypothetical protein